MIISFDLYKNPVHAITQFTGIFILKSRPKRRRIFCSFEGLIEYLQNIRHNRICEISVIHGLNFLQDVGFRNMSYFLEHITKCIHINTSTMKIYILVMHKHKYSMLCIYVCDIHYTYI